MLGDTVLVCLYYSSIEELIGGGNNLYVILIHTIGILDHTVGTIQLMYVSGIFPPKSEFVNGMTDIECFKGLIDEIKNVLEEHGLTKVFHIPPGCDMNIPPTRTECHNPMDVTALSMLVIAFHLVATLSNIDFLTIKMPSLAFIRPLHIVAGIAAFALISRTITRSAPILFIIVKCIIVIFQEGQGILTRQVFDMFLEEESGGEFGLGPSPDLVALLADPMLPYMVIGIEMKGLTLSIWILRVNVEERTWDGGECDIDLYFYAGGIGRIDVHLFSNGRCEIEVDFEVEEVGCDQEEECGEERSLSCVDAKFGCDGGVFVDLAKFLCEGEIFFLMRVILVVDFLI
mmetsp:Transcript_17742/g.25042  ORF Transcript_17742/g.25042 Transcript_17742/m.25042 type:complete len:344 (-) Transcript_17742:228-1259(-)